MSTFVFTDHGSDTYSLNSPRVAEVIRPFPDSELDAVELLGNSTRLPLRLIAVAVAATVTALVTAIARRRQSDTNR